MSETASTKPYMVRAIHEWCVDQGFTPYLAVEVDVNTRVPMAYVKDGEIVLNINYSATRDLMITNDAVTFSARFNGVSNDLYIPMRAVKGIFARENGQGLFFAEEETQDEAQVSAERREDDPEPEPPKKPSLRIVK
jgi:stringent starvation protein B